MTPREDAMRAYVAAQAAAEYLTARALLREQRRVERATRAAGAFVLAVTLTWALRGLGVWP